MRGRGGPGRPPDAVKKAGQWPGKRDKDDGLDVLLLAAAGQVRAGGPAPPPRREPAQLPAVGGAATRMPASYVLNHKEHVAVTAIVYRRPGIPQQDRKEASKVAKVVSRQISQIGAARLAGQAGRDRGAVAHTHTHSHTGGGSRASRNRAYNISPRQQRKKMCPSVVYGSCLCHLPCFRPCMTLSLPRLPFLCLWRVPPFSSSLCAFLRHFSRYVEQLITAMLLLFLFPARDEI